MLEKIMPGNEMTTEKVYTVNTLKMQINLLTF